MSKEIKKVENILKSFIDESIIPKKVIEECKGIIILQIIRAGFLLGIRLGSGVILSRTDKKTWSAASMVTTSGMSLGKLGADIMEVILIINSSAPFLAFCHGGKCSFEGDFKPVIGPKNDESPPSAPVYSYVRSKGSHVDLELGEMVINDKKKANQALYGKSCESILKGRVLPIQYNNLYIMLKEMSGYGELDIEYENNNCDSSIMDCKTPMLSVFTPLDKMVSDNNSQSSGSFDHKEKPLIDCDFQVTALFDYSSNQKDEISFKEGDIIHVTKYSKSEAAWWYGSNKEEKGVFPSNYVKGKGDGS